MNTNDNQPSVVKRTPSITPSGFFGSGKEMIVELENFMTQEEITFLEKAAKSITIWDVTQSHINENLPFLKKKKLLFSNQRLYKIH